MYTRKINFPTTELQNKYTNLTLLGKILVVAELRGIRSIAD